MLWPARKARQDQKCWIGIMSHLFGRIHRYYALRTSHDVVVAYFCLQLQICFELLDEGLPIFPGTKSQLTINRAMHVSSRDSPQSLEFWEDWSPTRTLHAILG
jgi:hypothetical protein